VCVWGERERERVNSSGVCVGREREREGGSLEVFGVV
jgi:hypothetical protein